MKLKHYIPPTYKKCSFNENLVLSKYILTFVWIFTSPHFSIWIFTSPHFSVWIFTSPHFSVWIFTSPHIWIFTSPTLLCLDFHFSHFASLLCLDFPLRPTSLGFSLRPILDFPLERKTKEKNRRKEIHKKKFISRRRVGNTNPQFYRGQQHRQQKQISLQ